MSGLTTLAPHAPRRGQKLGWAALLSMLHASKRVKNPKRLEPTASGIREGAQRCAPLLRHPSGRNPDSAPRPIYPPVTPAVHLRPKGGRASRGGQSSALSPTTSAALDASVRLQRGNDPVTDAAENSTSSAQYLIVASPTYVDGHVGHTPHLNVHLVERNAIAELRVADQFPRDSTYVGRNVPKTSPPPDT
jgi:hypothetical protein